MTLGANRSVALKRLHSNSSIQTSENFITFIGAGNIDKAVEIWSKSLSAGLEGKSYVDLLQNSEVLDKVGIKPPHGVLSKGPPSYVDLIHERDVLLDNFCLLEFLSPSCSN
ncbi:protein transport protein SEC31-like protein B [Cucumis melo var. makuwa]|uniref:Protein transport protein SEC31-like protein B n=1 Tax=Cucumis melo var. makuwa TaxID=1194695 RepID=A0A5A7U2Z2_CUCMM|nr:protein transport protein SEC31-like protein B [Cucumis melo var. makuwa]